ncbi:MAG: hypothetical protein KJ566_02340 [Nanoarchaeota archaeon]|nr:hypothetical protein [Nanoarchaeota archaeon]
MEQKNGFGFDRKDRYKKYVKKWVIIFSSTNSRNFSGWVSRITDENMFQLNPHVGTLYSPNQSPTYKLINSNFEIPVFPDTPIEISTKKNIENYCEYTTNEERLARELKLKNQPTNNHP